jgi:hypothetical protein
MAGQQEESEETRREEQTGKTDRRNFVRKLAAAVGGIATLAAAGTAAAGRQGAPVRVVVPIPEVPWRQRIYCQFVPRKHEELLGALRRCADETGCDIVFGEKGSPDLYAIGGFVLILDRSEMGEEWQECVEMYRDDADITPCFIIDDRKAPPLPNWDFTYRFDMADPGSVATIVEAIWQMKLEMNRRLPALFKEPRNSNSSVV